MLRSREGVDRHMTPKLMRQVGQSDEVGDEIGKACDEDEKESGNERREVGRGICNIKYISTGHILLVCIRF